MREFKETIERKIEETEVKTAEMKKQKAVLLEEQKDKARLKRHHLRQLKEEAVAAEEDRRANLEA